MIAFGPWRPDVYGPGSGFARLAEGGIPQAAAGGMGYGPFPQMVVAEAAVALSDAPRGIVSAQKIDRNWVVLVATADTIQILQSDYSFDDVETGRSTVPDGVDVSFAQYGAYLLNTDTANGMKAWPLAGGTNDAVTDAPAAQTVGVINNVVFAGNTSANPRRFQNSDLGNHAKWSGGVADGKTLEDGGAVICFADLKNGSGVLFQERIVRGIQFGAGAGAYSIFKIADGIGCVSERTRVVFDGRAWWWSEEGPWELSAGSAPVPIGAEKINRWAADSIGRQNYAALQGTIDPQRNLVLWRIDESRLLAYNYLLKDFTILPASTAALTRIATPAISIDSLSGTIDQQSGTIDSFSGGSAPVLGGLNASRKYATFTGPNMAATLETCVTSNPVTGLLGWATPVDDANSGTLQVGVADRLDAPLVWKSGTTKGSSGRTPQRARGMNIAFRRNIDAGATWTYANGVKDIARSSGGPR